MTEIDTKLQSMLDNEFNDEEQQIFLTHFKVFLNRDNDFIINIEFCLKWIGFSRKDNAKKLLEKNLTIDIDYIMLRQQKEQDLDSTDNNIKNWGGHNNEIILMTPNAFKQLCILANTDKGKQIRLYYIKMESVTMNYLKDKNEENEKIIKKITQKNIEATQKNKNLEYALKAEKENIARILNRRVHTESPGQVVYIYKESENKYKIGESSDISQREDQHRVSNTQNCVVYTKRCCNCKLLEKVVHHILDQYRDLGHREWFTVSFEIAKASLDSAHLFLDGLVDRCDVLDDSFTENLRNIMDYLPESKVTKNIIEAELEPEPETEPDPKQEPEINIDNIENPLNFDKFINEYCEKGDTFTIYSVEIFGAHRFWSRCTTKTVHNALYKYLCENYKKVKVFDSNTNAKLASYKGLKLKEIYKTPKITFSDPKNDLDYFIENMCEINYVTRVATQKIYKAFESWKQNDKLSLSFTDPDYTLNLSEKKRIDTSFKQRFVPALVFTGEKGQHGFFFVNLKESPTEIGFKLAAKLKKKVYKIDIITKQIVETFESLTAAAASIHRVPSTLSEDIKYKKPRDNFIYQYA
jgi:phage anti-repressor protein